MLNLEQEQAVNDIIAAYNNGAVMMTLSGGPGTGKTYTTGQVVRRFASSGKTVAIAASTNHAIQIARDTAINNGWYHLVNWWGTAHKLLGMTIRDGRSVPRSASKAGKYDIVIIDEASMLSFDIVRRIRHDSAFALFVGDRNQLPPIDEDKPVAFIAGGVRLTKSVRHQNNPDLDTLVKYAETAIDDPDGIPISLLEPFIVRDLKSWEDGIGKNENEVAISFTNLEAARLNRLIRRGSSREYDFGDRLIFKGPLYRDNRLVVATNSIARVDGASKSYQDGFPTWQLRVNVDGKTLYIQVPDTEFDNGNYAKFLKSIGKRPPAYSNVAFAYAITAHRSQGGEYDTVHVQMSDFMRCQDDKIRRKLAYVAFSRAKKNLYLYIGG